MGRTNLHLRAFGNNEESASHGLVRQAPPLDGQRDASAGLSATFRAKGGGQPRRLNLLRMCPLCQAVELSATFLHAGGRSAFFIPSRKTGLPQSVLA
jgi:hypothetical protein